MSKKRTSSRKESSVVDLVIISSGIFALAFFIIPNVFPQNTLFRILTAILQPTLIVFGGLFVLIAISKLFRHHGQNLPVSKNNVFDIDKLRVVNEPSGSNTQSGYAGFKQTPFSANKYKKSESWSIELLQKIEWKLFEDLSAAYYNEKGIRAELTKLGADGGIDIKLFQDDSGKPTSLVQCKAWNSRQVGVKEIREFLGVMSHEKIPKGFFMASGSYTHDAQEIAKANRITLIDGVMLLAMIQRLPTNAQQRLLDLATEGDYTTPSCPSCGVKMLRRTGKRGDFWGCKNFPKCRQMLYIKSGQ